MLSMLISYSLAYTMSLTLIGYPDPYERFLRLRHHHPILDARLGGNEVNAHIRSYPCLTSFTGCKYPPVSFHTESHHGLHLVLHGDGEVESTEKGALEIPFKIIIELELGEPVEIVHP